MGSGLESWSKDGETEGEETQKTIKGEGPDLSFAEQDLHAIEELGQRAGQTEGQDPVHHHQELGGHIWTLVTWFSSSPHIRERMTEQDTDHDHRSHGSPVTL